MGRVYRAYDPRLDREIALKVLSQQMLDNPDFIERFRREGRASASINHPHVISCFEVDEAVDGTLYMAMELVSGGDGLDLLKRNDNQLKELHALHIIAECAEGLQAIDDAGMIHRDIKPANIFFTGSGAAKIADLGLVRDAEDTNGLTMAGQPLGTPTYMAPEQARGESNLDIGVDIYALGITLFCFLCGRPPFVGENVLSIISQVLRDEAPPVTTYRQDIDQRTVAIIQRCLHKERTQRYQQPRHLAQACRELGQKIKDERKAQVTAVQSQQTQQSERKHTSRRVSLMQQAHQEEASKKYNVAALATIAKRVHITKDGLQAWISLAPGVCFPVQLLTKVLEFAGVTYGVRPEVLKQAARRAQSLRRLVLAKGDDPAPGMRGRSVTGDELDEYPLPIQVRVSDDAMEAYALYVPGAPLAQKHVEMAVCGGRIRFGLDKQAITNLWQHIPNPSGRVTIARGKPMVAGRPAGFCLSGAFAGLIQDDAAKENLSSIKSGDIIARWEDELPGVKGMNVHGEEISPPLWAQPDPQRLAGEGTSLSRDHNGLYQIISKRNGLVQQQCDGIIRVIQAVEISGDLGPDTPPVNTDEVVVVRGDVNPGAEIHTKNDIVIMGDLKDAKIEAGGNVEVQGDVLAGGEAIECAGSLAVLGDCKRQVIAGDLRINGIVEHCELIAAGDIFVERIIGGCLTAGGSLTCEIAGDESGITTELWAGHNHSANVAVKKAQELEAQFAQQSREAMAAYRENSHDLNRAAQRHKLITAGGAYTNQKVVAEAEAALNKLKEIDRQLTEKTEDLRARLGRQRIGMHGLVDSTTNDEAGIHVKKTAYEGVVAKVADGETVALRQDQQGFDLE